MLKRYREHAAAQKRHEQEDGEAKKHQEEEAAAKKLDTRRPAWLCSGDESRCGALNVRVYHTDALEMTPEQRADYERQYPHGIPVNHPSLLIGSRG